MLQVLTKLVIQILLTLVIDDCIIFTAVVFRSIVCDKRVQETCKVSRNNIEIQTSTVIATDTYR